MLLSDETLKQIDAESDRLFRNLAKDLFDSTLGPSRLERAFLAGRVAAITGPDLLRDMPFSKVLSLAKENGLVGTQEEAALFGVLQAETRKWLSNMQDEFNKRLRISIATAESKWAHEVISRSATGHLRKADGKSLWEELRDSALGSLAIAVTTIFGLFESVVDRFMQTELAKYFQSGQSAEIADDEEIYKIPRPQACQHCMRLHLDQDGRPKVYKLRDVRGNTNVGKKAGQWEFVLGPVHPHCYCVLFTVANRPPVASDLLAAARRESLAVGLKRRKEILEEAKLRYQEAIDHAKSG